MFHSFKSAKTWKLTIGIIIQYIPSSLSHVSPMFLHVLTVFRYVWTNGHRPGVCSFVSAPGRSRIRCQRLPSPREAQWLDDLGSHEVENLHIWWVYIYILFTYYLHIFYILFTYYLHVMYILFTYYVHIIYILFTYYVHIIYILFTYMMMIIWILLLHESLFLDFWMKQPNTI